MTHLLLENIHSSFRNAFGQPYSTLARDSQWSLRADGDPRAPTIFVLVNGSHEKPAAWIFDPYDGDDSVWRCSIESETHIEEAIAEIRKRLTAAAAWRPENSHVSAQAPKPIGPDFAVTAPPAAATPIPRE